MEIIRQQLSVVGINIDGEKFDKTSRAHMHNNDTSLVLDYHNQLLSLVEGNRVEIIIYQGCNDDAVPEYYTYVMNGRVYSIDEEDGHFRVINASFGGLCLMMKVRVGVLDSLNEFSEIVIGVRVLGQ